jgi:hypothetical protein
MTPPPPVVIDLAPPAAVEVQIEPQVTEVAVIPPVPVVVELDTDIRVGPAGPIGPPGEGALYVHHQVTAATEWVMTHNFGRSPSAIRFLDSGGAEWHTHTFDRDPNTTVAQWKFPFGGTARLMG